MTEQRELKVDPDRSSESYSTGIYVRATLAGKWGSHDIGVLEFDSLVAWLTDDRGKNYAINVIAALLGHERRLT